jgi:hypothetical protein
MDPLTLALIGGGIGAGKSILVDGPAAQRQNMLTAARIKYSPWTHYQWDGKMADPTGNMSNNIFAFGGAGLQYGLLNKKAQGSTDAAQQSAAPDGQQAPASDPTSGSTDISDYLYKNRGKTQL